MTMQSGPVQARMGVSPSGHAPAPAPPSPPHQSLVEATGETMPPHHVPSLTRLCRDKLERMIADPTDRDLSAIRCFPADIHLLDPLDKKPSVSLLECACTVGALDVVKYLVEDRKQIPDFSCLERASSHVDIAVLKYVCRYISPDTLVPGYDMTLLQVHCLNWNVEAVYRFLQVGADPDKGTKRWPPPLAMAILELVDDPNQYDAGLRQLFREKTSIQEAVMMALIENDANVNAYFVSSELVHGPKTILDTALIRKNTAAASLLRQYGAKSYVEISSEM
jgi:hypothetical protein